MVRLKSLLEKYRDDKFALVVEGLTGSSVPRIVAGTVRGFCDAFGERDYVVRFANYGGAGIGHLDGRKLNGVYELKVFGKLIDGLFEGRFFVGENFGRVYFGEGAVERGRGYFESRRDWFRKYCCD
jgi:hypothetical protein